MHGVADVYVYGSQREKIKPVISFDIVFLFSVS